jgi:hypothetical protein
MIKKDSWVQIKKTIFTPNERSTNVPKDTKLVPFDMWVKGFLQDDASLGDWVVVKTVTGRTEEGKLVDVNPTFLHNYGTFVPENLTIARIVKTIVFGDQDE